MNCKPGDIARIVKDSFPQNQQRLVQVTGACTDQYDIKMLTKFFGSSTDWWECTALQTIMLHDVMASGIIGAWEIRAGETCLFKDGNLRPLPGELNIEQFDLEATA